MCEKALTSECMFDILFIERLFATFVRGCMEEEDMSDAMRATMEIYNNQSVIYDKSRIRSIKNRERREKQLRRRIITFVIMISVVVFISIFLSFSFMSDAKNNGEHKDNRYYSCVSIKAGDTIWSIAEQNMDLMHYNNVESYVRDIASVNKIRTDSELISGTSLIIPYYSDEEK